MSALEAIAVRAGAALACSYGSYAEYHAALIEEWRAAARARRHWRQGLTLAVACLAALVAVIALRP
ncbi:MAG TPA: hypothetical protein VHA77_17905 [Xanthobacteraceae bacterium]|nr:hypothetical protein [Xanthobacteraceae bacterium]